MNLTKKVIDQAEYEGTGRSRCMIWDDRLPGFGVRIYPTGRKAFVLSYRAGGRKRLMTIGTFGVLTLDQARKQARAELVAIDQGNDPIASRRASAQVSAFKDLAAAYIEEHAKPKKKSWREDQRYLKNDLLPALGSLRASTITRRDLSVLHAKKGGTHPYAANRMIEVARSLFSWAERERLLPAGHANPASGIDPFPEFARERFVQPSELPALADAISTLRNVYARAAIWLYLLTGLRKQELLRTRWENVDLERATLFLPDTKSGKPHTVPLIPQAVAILERLPREEGNPFVFCSRMVEGSHLKSLQKSWNNARRRAGMEDVRIHDLRRTVGSWMAMSGSPLLVIGKTLGHTSTAATMVYARLNDDPVRSALESHAKQMEVLTKGGLAIDI